MYAIVDIETTGSSANYGKITEVAILIHDGKRVIDEYQTLINPERGIPMNITALTGITNEMVRDAPRFFEVAKEIYQMLEGNIFVAHNVNFDYSFLKNEFQQLGGTLNLKKLCTVRLSRKVFPGYKSYSLGVLCDHLKIANHARHRAMGDARATAELMDLIIQNDSNHIETFLKKDSKEADLPQHLPKEVFEALPEFTGVYYFHDAHGEILYVGKANNIKKRVRGHFSNTDVVYKQGLKDKLYDITYEACGDEMIALLFESSEIKKHFPIYNKAQKFTVVKYGLYHYYDGKGFQRLSIGKSKKGNLPLIGFSSFDRARDYLIELVKKYGLDPELCSLPASMAMYFGYSIKTEGNGSENQNHRFQQAIKSIKGDSQSFCLLGAGRTPSEKSVALVENGKYLGFGYYESDLAFNSIEEVKNAITKFPDTPDIQRIINAFYTKRKVIKFTTQNQAPNYGLFA
ncbi:exonuclease domain-containing protein [Roseivirga echinicomitans]